MASSFIKNQLAFVIYASQMYFLFKSSKVNRSFRSKANSSNPDKAGESLIRAQQPAEEEDEDEEEILVDKSRLPNWDRRVRMLYLLSWMFHLISVLKYSAICLLDLKELRAYRWLDCILLGRLAITGRVTGQARYVALFLSTAHLVWRANMHLRKPDIRLDCFEFLLCDDQTVLINEFKSKADQASEQPIRGAQSRAWLHDDARGYLREARRDDDHGWEPQKRRSLYHFIFYLRRFGPRKFTYWDPPKSDYILRPSRSFASWLKLSRMCLVLTVVFVALSVVPMAVIMRGMGPLLITNHGFELAYENCMESSTRMNSNSSSSLPMHLIAPVNLSWVRQNERRAFLPIEGIVSFGAYQLARLLADIIDNYYIWVDTYMAFVVYTYIGFILVVDVLSYSKFLRNRLQLLVYELSKQNRKLASSGNKSLKINPRPDKCHNQAKVDLRKRQLVDDIETVQSLLIDHFNLIRRYNNFASFYTLFSVTLFLCYSVVVCGWMFSGKTFNDAAEWYLMEALSMVVVIVIIGGFAQIHASSALNYRLITRAMALDDSILWTKLRWSIIINFYEPTPLQCFTLFQRYEISWLLCIKLTTWLLSAALIVYSFFAINRL